MFEEKERSCLDCVWCEVEFMSTSDLGIKCGWFSKNPNPLSTSINIINLTNLAEKELINFNLGKYCQVYRSKHKELSR